MFPGPGATIIRNEAGEPLGWDSPSEYSPYDDDLIDDRDDRDRWDDRDDFVDGLFDWHEHAELSELAEVHKQMSDNGIEDPCTWEKAA